MRNRQFKELWRIRFLNILNLEREANLFYAHLLKNNRTLLEETSTITLLEQILNDRKERIRTARELIRLTKQKPVSERKKSLRPGKVSGQRTACER